MACNPSKIIAALHEEKQNITDIVRENIEVSDRMVLRKISDGGVVARNSNQESIIYGEGQQASMAYKSLDHAARPDLVAGNMNGRNLAGQNGIFVTSLNSIDDNACHGFCTINFAQGFRIRGFEDYGIDVDTPIKCARELDRLGASHIRGFFEGFRRHFTKFGLDNFSDNLLNLVIQNSEANASVLGADSFAVSTGGWQAPPTHRISIHFLEEYRDYIMAEMEMLGMTVPENFKLEVELPRDDWFDAVREHQIRRNAMLIGAVPMVEFEGKLMEDPEDKMRGREFHDFGKIRCYFNDRPIRGFFKQVGTTSGNANYEFVRVHHWKNDPGEVGGLVIKPNHLYREDRIQVDGVWFDMVTLVPHIDPRSFKRYRLQKPILMDGAEANMGVNYEVKVVDGADIANNIHRDKFGLAARHEFRFKTMYPEISGFIAYRHGRREGYAIEVVPRNLVPGPNNFSAPEEFRECDLIDPVTIANCAACGEVPTSEGNCVAAGAAALGVVGLDPAGALLTDFTGVASTVTLKVRRTGDLAKAASVNYTITAGTAVAGTHFTAVAATTLNFAAGAEYATIVANVIEGSGNPAADVTFLVTLATPVGCTLKTGATVATVTINDIS